VRDTGIKKEKATNGKWRFYFARRKGPRSPRVIREGGVSAVSGGEMIQKREKKIRDAWD